MDGRRDKQNVTIGGIIELNLPKIVLGRTIKSLLYAYKNELPVIIHEPSKPSDVEFISQTHDFDFLHFEYKPTYGFDVKALFNMSGVKFGPEVRFQKMEQVNGGGLGFGLLKTDGDLANNADLVGTNIDFDTNGSTANKIKTDKKERDEVMIGLSFSAPITDRINMSGGYLTAKADKMEAEFTTSISDEQTWAWYAKTASFSKFDLQTSKPTLDLYYVSLGMSF